METVFRSLACLNGSFLQSNDAHMCCTMKNHGLNMADAEIAFGYLGKMENLSLKSIVRNRYFCHHFQTKSSYILNRIGYIYISIRDTFA